MGVKLSTSIAKKKRRITNSLQSPRKSYNANSIDLPSIRSSLTNPDYSEKQAAPSISSITESTFMSGRRFHHVANSAYWFPNDNEEMDRLVGQHFALKTLFGGNISNTILRGIDMENSNTVVLDLGCGPGTWLMDVATEYPSSQFIGVDMCDVFPNNIRPPNVSFQKGNALERLPFSDGTFDFVNIRLFIIALKGEEWPIVIQEAYRILKPGGYIQVVECGMLERGNEFVKYVGKIFKQVIEGRGQEPYIAFKLQSLLESQMFQLEHYENKDVFLGKPDPLSREFLWDACNILKSAQPVLQDPLGCNADNYPQFLDKLYRELQKKPDAMWSFSICAGKKNSMITQCGEMIPT
ncbi:S-adenosyl-L-methionine-dependent methyltransferase [Parasitella parasitica]|nr:S-adenosyl-L-methionine-dependent methyltransferase [Parasitella parasitica]